ncbi:ribose 5-phosphate isomerase B [Pectinatus sottacetonis]|uniref:ribose 5-phosphate isomerase B n=1 Tax=Pectinatus sottacetonis TaxID=1002795 RepID=UPI0018C46466|nr:ribose 5-phosphate isomerase B [Pectinatus sottacetonis]
MKIVIGCDQGALTLKEHIKEVLKEFKDIIVEDVGTYTTDSVDYPDIAEKICDKITSGQAERGIALCGTGIGISIACNKVKGIRAALCHNAFTARMSRQHNDANVLAMGGRDISFGPADEIVRIWLTEKFLGGRHERRVNKIMSIEDK